MLKWGQLAVLGAVLSFGIGNVIVVDSTLTGPQVAFWRYLIASAGYCAIHRAFVGPVRWADFKIAAPAGIALGLEIALFFMSIRNTTVANTSLIGTMTPLVLFGVAARRFGERISAKLIAVTGIALIGVVLVVFGSSGAAEWSVYGDVLAVGSMIVYSLYFIAAKIAREDLAGFTLQTHVLLAGTPVLLAISLIQTRTFAVPSGGEWWHVFGLILFPTTGHLLINWSHRYVPLTMVSLLLLGVPVASVAAALIFLDDSVVALQIMGAAIVLAALAYAIIATSRIESSHTAETAMPDTDH